MRGGENVGRAVGKEESRGRLPENWSFSGQIGGILPVKKYTLREERAATRGGPEEKEKDPTWIRMPATGERKSHRCLTKITKLRKVLPWFGRKKGREVRVQKTSVNRTRGRGRGPPTSIEE